jgi:hypothetical protein
MAVIAATLATALSGPAAAFAVGGPNEAANSGHFHPNKDPCVNNPDHPNCPVPH